MTTHAIKENKSVALLASCEDAKIICEHFKPELTQD